MCLPVIADIDIRLALFRSGHRFIMAQTLSVSERRLFSASKMDEFQFFNGNNKHSIIIIIMPEVHCLR